MTHKYLNTSFTTGASVFTDLEADAVEPVEVRFSARAIKAQVAGQTIPMVKYKVDLRKVTATIPQCGDCPVYPVESCSFEVNFIQGVDPAAMRVELLRLVDAAVTNYGLDRGNVPPPQAQFVSP